MPKGIKGSNTPKPPSARQAAGTERERILTKKGLEAVRDRNPVCRCARPIPSGRWYRNPDTNTKFQVCLTCDNPMTHQTHRAVVGAAYGF